MDKSGSTIVKEDRKEISSFSTVTDGEKQQLENVKEVEELTSAKKQVKVKDKPAKESKSADATEDTTAEEEDTTAEEEVKSSIPKYLNINDLRNMTIHQLSELGQEIGIIINTTRSKSSIIFDIINFCVRRETLIETEGILILNNKNIGYVRSEKYSFATREDDAYVSPSLVRKYGLRSGNLIKCKLKAPKSGEKYLAVLEVLEIEGKKAEDFKESPIFEDLTPCHPSERIILESQNTGVACRILDLIAPLGMGQRALIAAPPRGGKTVLLKEMAQSIVKNYPKVKLMIVLLDERPEEVTDFIDTVPGGKIYSSTFDEPANRHIEVAEVVIQRAKRLVEQGENVVILLDSLTRLARGYNVMQSGDSASLSGGLSKTALDKPRRFFSSARKTEEKGSLTIVATALIETESRADEIIFEEFKGTGNLEVYIDSELAERRIFPAIHFSKTGTRKDELLYHPEEFDKINLIRKQLAQVPSGEAMQILINSVKKTKTNTELLLANSLKG